MPRACFSIFTTSSVTLSRLFWKMLVTYFIEMWSVVEELVKLNADMYAYNTWIIWAALRFSHVLLLTSFTGDVGLATGTNCCWQQIIVEEGESLSTQRCGLTLTGGVIKRTWKCDCPLDVCYKVSRVAGWRTNEPCMLQVQQTASVAVKFCSFDIRCIRPASCTMNATCHPIKYRKAMSTRFFDDVHW